MYQERLELAKNTFWSKKPYDYVIIDKQHEKYLGQITQTFENVVKDKKERAKIKPKIVVVGEG